MATRLSWQPDDAAAIAAQVADALKAGRLAVVPTESGDETLAWGQATDAIERLAASCSEEPIAVALRGHDEIAAWMPQPRGRFAHLARKAWPGPLGLWAEAAEAATNLSEALRRAVWSDRGLALRMPAAPLVESIQAQVEGPLLIVAVGLENAAIRVEWPDRPEPVLVTWVRAGTDRCEVVRAGGIPAEHVHEDAAQSIVFVCTGNTCRSPMAASLCRTLLAEALGCGVAELPSRGFRVQSAGLSAMMGQSASEHAAETVRTWGADLSGHRSQRLTANLYCSADRIYAMTQSHLDVLESVPPQAIGPRMALLSPYNEDVADPFGGDASDYRACAEQILGALKLRLPEILGS